MVGEAEDGAAVVEVEAAEVEAEEEEEDAAVEEVASARGTSGMTLEGRGAAALPHLAEVVVEVAAVVAVVSRRAGVALPSAAAEALEEAAASLPLLAATVGAATTPGKEQGKSSRP